MSRSSGWELRVGPFHFRVGVRTLDLDAPATAAAQPPAPGALEVGRIRLLEDPVAGGDAPAPERKP